MWELKVESSFAAAHHLLNYEGECENQHGHNWKVEVYIEGNKLDKSNILLDFKVLKKFLKDVLQTLDHKDLNELEFFKNQSPSSEIICRYIYYALKKDVPNLKKVSVWETANACSSYFE